MRSRALWVAAALTLVAPSAHANGRYPQAQHLIEAPGAPERLWLRTTYGILTSADRGKTWGWICEGAAGYSGTIDPAIAVFADGGLAVALIDGLTISRDGGCSFTRAAELEGREIADVSVERGDATRALALESEHTGGGLYTTRVHRSVDSGKSWQPLGSALPANLRGLTLDAAPSDPGRIYVSGFVTDANEGGVLTTAGVVFASNDGGGSWSRADLADSDVDSPPFLAAVHPTDPDTVYVRARGHADVLTAAYPEDRLLVSSDGGKSFVEILKKSARLLGFALSPDGATVLAGFGDPFEIIKVEVASLGLYRAEAATHAFARIREGHFGCLTWTASGLLACTLEAQTGFELGSFGALQEPAQGLLVKKQIRPLECAAGTVVAEKCPAAWFPQVCVPLGTCAASGDSGVGGDSGAAGAAGSLPASARGGCGLGRARAASWFALGALGLAALGVWFRRRRSVR